MNTSRIIFINRFFYPDQSATSRILSDLAFALARDGAAVSVIASQGLYNDSDVALAPYESVNGVNIHRIYRPHFSRGALWGRAFDYLAMYGRFAATAVRLSKPGDCLVVKTDPPMLGVALAPVVRWKRLKVINWLQDLYPEVALALGFGALAPIERVLVAARNASLRKATATVAIGERMKRRVEAAGVESGRIAIIENWCDDTFILPLPHDANALRKDWGLTGKFVVGYSGNLGRAHEYETLLDAATRLRAQEDIVYLFIGGGHLLERLKQDVLQRGLGEAFMFLPYQPENILTQSLGAPDIHWLSQPPSMEGLILPSKFYGIAAVGRPIAIVGDVTGELSERVRANDCGEAFAVGDGQSLARFILAMKDDPSRAAQMGANARRMLEAGLTRRHAILKWRDLLGSL